MIGLDTTTLIAFEVADHPLKHQVTKGIQVCINNGEIFAIAPQVFNEFLHVVTDAKRFKDPLSMPEGLDHPRNAFLFDPPPRLR